MLPRKKHPQSLSCICHVQWFMILCNSVAHFFLTYTKTLKYGTRTVAVEIVRFKFKQNRAVPV